MGLDIVAYRRLTPAPNAPVSEADDGNPVDYERFTLLHPEVMAWAEQAFPGRAEGISPGVYSYDEKFGFHAGSYGGYNEWREELARRAGYPVGDGDERHRHSSGAWAAGGGPFWELIHFSDSEGVIGPVVSAKIANDFATFQDAAGKVGWFAECYAKWRRAFEMAADGGAVYFR